MEETSNKKYWIIFGLVVLAGVILRLPVFLSSFINIDENEYAIAAMKILDGGLPYKDFLIYQPPLIYYFYALAFKLFGTHIWGAHVLMIFVVVLTSFVVSQIAKLITNDRWVGLIAAFFYLVFTTTFKTTDMLGANCELLAVLPISISILLIVSSENTKNYWTIFWGGIFCGLAVLIKYQAGVAWAAVSLFILLNSVLKKEDLGNAILKALIYTAGTLFVASCCATFFWKMGVWKETAEAWEYIIKYSKGPQQITFEYLFLKFLIRSALVIISGLIMWTGAIARLPKIKENLLVSLWFLLSIIPVLVGGRIFFHYYIWIFPAAAILGAIWVKGWWKNGHVAIKGIFIFTFCLTITFWPSFTLHKILKLDPKSPYKEITNFLQTHSGNAKTIFVWGYAPQIYIESGLAAATRFTTADYLTGRTPSTDGIEFDPNSKEKPTVWEMTKKDFTGVKGTVNYDTSANTFPRAWEYLKADFEARMPDYFIDTSLSNYRFYGRYPISKYPYLAEVIANKYTLVFEKDGYLVYKLNSGDTHGMCPQKGTHTVCVP